MRKFCLADKTVNSFVIAVYMPMMCWRNGVLVNWKNDDLFSVDISLDYSHQNMRLCTKNNNEFDGEPDTALKTDAFEIVDDFEAEQ